MDGVDMITKKVECKCTCGKFAGLCEVCDADLYKKATPPQTDKTTWEDKLSKLMTRLSENYLIDDEFELILKSFIAELLKEEREKAVIDTISHSEKVGEAIATLAVADLAKQEALATYKQQLIGRIRKMIRNINGRSQVQQGEILALKQIIDLIQEEVWQ
jgi:hypothetical protein